MYKHPGMSELVHRRIKHTFGINKKQAVQDMETLKDNKSSNILMSVHTIDDQDSINEVMN